MILDSSLWNLEMRYEWSVMVIGRLEVVLVLHLSPPSYTVLEHSWHHYSLQDRHHDRWDATRSHRRRQRISWSLRKYPILFQSWLVFGSPIDLTTSFDWKERRFRVLDTGIQSEGNFKRVGWNLQLSGAQGLVHRVLRSAWAVQGQCLPCQSDQAVKEQQATLFFDQTLGECEELATAVTNCPKTSWVSCVVAASRAFVV